MGLFWLNQAGVPPAVLGPNILSKGVETDLTRSEEHTSELQSP